MKNIQSFRTFTKNEGFYTEYEIANKTGSGSISEEEQLSMVNQSGNSIKILLDEGITPSQEVQIAAAKENGEAIHWIIQSGIELSPEVQMAAVGEDPNSIRYIKNPTQEVREIYFQKTGNEYKH
jgi:hypothetical protein